jgi:hypothetical protein
MNQRNTKNTHAEELSMDELYDCYRTLARIIKKYGKEYLPLFERVHNEIEMRKKENRLLEIALKVADENGNSSNELDTSKLVE